MFSKKKIKPWVKSFGRLLLKVFTVIVALYICLTQVTGFYYYRGNDMFPAIKDGDLLVLDRISELILNDVVVYQTDEGESRVGRVVAKPGDFVSMTDNGELLVNGCIPAEEVFYATTANPASSVTYPYCVEEGKYFILNDYRTGMNDSYSDSRTYGAVDADQIEGKVTLRIQKRGF